jgi:hypothetical protein
MLRLGEPLVSQIICFKTEVYKNILWLYLSVAICDLKSFQKQCYLKLLANFFKFEYFDANVG